jgi:hypothetical protein
MEVKRCSRVARYEAPSTRVHSGLVVVLVRSLSLKEKPSPLARLSANRA